MTGECLSSVLRVSPRWAVEYAGRFLNDPDPGVRSVAALALGESRKPAALEPLAGRLKAETDPEVRKPLALAVAMLRTPESRELLLSLIRGGRPADAADAVEAMGLYKHDGTVRAAVEEAVRRQGDADTARALRTAFGA